MAATRSSSMPGGSADAIGKPSAVTTAAASSSGTGASVVSRASRRAPCPDTRRCQGSRRMIRREWASLAYLQ